MQAVRLIPIVTGVSQIASFMHAYVHAVAAKIKAAEDSTLAAPNGQGDALCLISQAQHKSNSIAGSIAHPSQ